MNIAVYCGSKIGLNPKFSQAAKDLGSWLAQKNTP